MLTFSYLNEQGEITPISIEEKSLLENVWLGNRLKTPLALHVTGGTLVQIDQRLVVNITVAKNSKYMLEARVRIKLPSPFPVGVEDFEEDLVFDIVGNSQEWTVNGASLPWFKGTTEAIGGNLDQWLTVRADTSPGLELKSEAPVLQMGLCSKEPNLRHCNVAFVTGPEVTTSEGKNIFSLTFVLIPYAHWKTLGSKYDGTLSLAGVSDLAMDRHNVFGEDAWNCPVVFFFSLSANSQFVSSPYGWRAVVQWRPQGKGSVPGITGWDVFSRIWNRGIAFSTLGARMPNAGTPWNSLPLCGSLPKDSCRPLFVFRCVERNNSPKLCDVFFYAGLPQKPPQPSTINFRFPWQSAFTVPPGSVNDTGPFPFSPPVALANVSLSVSGHLQSETLGTEQDGGWNDPSDPRKNGQMSIATSKDLIARSSRADRAGSDLLADWKIENVNATGPKEWFSVGSLEFRVGADWAGEDNKGNVLQLILRGKWSLNECDVYPEMHLERLPCEVRLSSGSDPDQRRLRAIFDSLNRTERDLQDETGPVIGAIKNLGDQGGVIKGLLSIRVRCEPGRNAVTEWRVHREPGAMTPSSSFYFQARPFSIARIAPPDIDPEAGLDLAYWRSDDPEGPQWRVADATVEMDLPPQSVAEEMERGSRFWPVKNGEKKPYMDPSIPVRYRFSPPTRLSVRPSVDGRRYNPVPNNLSQILKSAKIESFTTELVHPVRIDFRVDEKGLPDVRIAESASFFGRPSPNLPPLGETEWGNVASDLARQVLAAELADWLVVRNRPSEGVKFIAGYRELRAGQSANRATFAARLGKYHLYDPYRQDRGLALKNGLRFALREARKDGKPGTHGAPPLLNPLPGGSEVPLDRLKDVSKFVDPGTNTWVCPINPDKPNDPNDAKAKGSIRGGVIHTIEFASELCAVLRQPGSDEGVIEQLAFSALGASGSMWVSFDEGRTKFVAEFTEGQLMRLKKVRIGRIGVVWNRAIHVVVYERTVAPARQFIDEQSGNQLLGWPVLRKTEEYVEPTEQVRAFSAEPVTAESPPGFVEASEFVTPRVYVNGAWGHDLGHGYEIPLWNRNDTSGFYPKPNIALRLHAGIGETSRAWHDRPEELFFYTNTEPGTGHDPDSWVPQLGVDLSDEGPMRRGAFIDVQENPIDMDTVPAPSPDCGRRPRFDFRVTCDGRANLQHNRAETPMLAELQVITLARTGKTGPIEPEKLPETVRSEVKRVQKLANRGAQLDQVQSEIDAFLRKLPGEFLFRPDPTALENHLKEEADKLFNRVSLRIKGLSDNVDEINATEWPSLQSRLKDELMQRLAVPPRVIAEVAKALSDEIERAIKLPSQQLDAELSHLQGRLSSYWSVAVTSLEQTSHAIEQGHLLPAKELQELESDCVEMATKLRGLVGATEAEIEKKLGETQDRAVVLRLKIASLKVPQLQTILHRIESLARQVESLTTEAEQQGSTGAQKKLITPLETSLGETAGALVRICNNIDHVIDKLGSAQLQIALTPVRTAAGIVSAKLQGALWTTSEQARQELKEVSQWLGHGESAVKDSFLKSYNDWADSLAGKAEECAGEFDAEMKILCREMVTTVSAFRRAFKDNSDVVLTWLENQRDHVKAAIHGIAGAGTGALYDVRNKITAELEATRAEVEIKVTSVVQTIINDLASSPALAIANDLKRWSDPGSKALKLIKVIGDLPELPHLKFNANRAEYVFDDLKKQIQTSPFAARLREIDGGLKELGLAVPTRELLDQFVPDISVPVDFNKIYRNLGGLELADMLKKFRLDALSGEQVKITHGMDRATRSAWVKARVQADYPGQQTLFEFSSLAVTVSDLSLRGNSDVSIALDGSRKSVTESTIKGDWALVFGSTPLVAFREVAVRFDGRDFQFTISPDKVELHPALRFINEIGKKIGESLPPAITILRDSRGIPAGVAANLSTVVRNPPPLGPVTLGTFAITAGLGLSVQPDGKFVLETHVSVGTRETPLFLQIGFLGGGLWVAAKASYLGGRITYQADVGLAVGSTRALTVGGVARASFSILLFAYATFHDGGGEFHAGLSIRGSARILGFCRADVGLLLEVTHESSGESHGHGVLDVEVEICWCYTLRLHREVQQKL